MSEKPTTPLAYTIVETARITTISRSTLYELIASGELPSVKLGGRRLIRHIDLEHLLEQHLEAL